MLDDTQSILLIDDDADVLQAYSALLQQEGYQVYPCSNPLLAQDLIPDNWPGIIISDVCMPEISGLALLEQLHAADNQLPVLMITGHGDVPMAVEAVKKGAYDFLQKPVNPVQLLALIKKALTERRDLIEQREWRKEQLGQHLIGRSGWMRNLRQQLATLAETDLPVCLYGELGTGRMMAAKYLHRLSALRDNPLICQELTSGTEQPLHQWIELAHGGSLLLRNIEYLSQQNQRYLTQLQDRQAERHFRLIVTSQLPPAELAARQLLIPELYYLFSMTQIECVPLSKRPGDIEDLFRHYLINACKRLNRQLPQLGDAFMKKLTTRLWPGNVRELANAAELVAVGVLPMVGPVNTLATDADPTPLDERIENYERRIIIEALNIHQGRINDVAEYFQIPRKKLYLRMKKYGIDKMDYRY
ncbi:two-component system response regulator PgtA [Budvicia aquatica]|uniref:C4-dicarboxylate transport transcriptional regulatory protein dctD n=1 Tax=Budvicia aquatica TaxID=82979 RepID=A0A2C6DKK1_9GAMM|nr:sigma-54 dependent transcriptional regulator [Budvicia aquatica]PHI29294.1 sigma-54-dependent Fis family transcriptional regulator [Budvicia aquatica]GKX51443.1 transcriptional regulator [Budvicia aquatica]VFS47518.1 C4-dicarboxylate transport transcriptional regulatory protein dctD [Budvicia aquatica]